jgi:hypothetical protein
MRRSIRVLSHWSIFVSEFDTSSLFASPKPQLVSSRAMAWVQAMVSAPFSAGAASDDGKCRIAAF